MTHRRRIGRTRVRVGVLAGLVGAAVAIVLLGVLAAGSGDGISDAVEGFTVPSPDARDHVFLHHSRTGEPVRWDPCTPIHYVTDLRDGPAGALDTVHEAFARTAAVTGVRFIDDGPTTQASSEHRLEEVFGRLDDRGRLVWPPVRVALMSREEMNRIPNSMHVKDAVGLSRAVARGGVYVSGDIELREDLEARFGARGLGTTLLHELGHLLGLGHVKGAGELMNPYSYAHDWGPGDLAGLRRLGREQGCLDAPLPRTSAKADRMREMYAERA